MSLRYHYDLEQVHNPVLALGGRYVRPRPLIPIAIVGPAGTSLREALLDTGADDTVFREAVATAIGLDLTNAPQGSGSGVGLGPVLLRFAEVTLRLATDQEQREWKAWVGFTPAKLRFAVLGFAGCLQYFDALFRGGLEEVELTVNDLYPGT
ncbi:MAG TPA: hypothetical protein VNK04_15420 [Gemmataceae bacterium]|nr:hypothetical protein [Gemmataceae bacterium]